MSLDRANVRRQADSEWCEAGKWSYELAQPRSTRFLLVRVVTAEDRMEAMGDEHEHTNIDLEYCGAHGVYCE